MLRSLRSLIGHTISALDGDIGTVDDFYFDSESWTLRYLVVNTGDWLSGRRVLLVPSSLGRPGWSEKTFPVNLTRKQVENSPDIDTDKPVSRQHEAELHHYYGWEPYWNFGYYPGVPGMGPGIFTGVPPVTTLPEQKVVAEEVDGNPNLHGVNEVLGYRIEAQGGRIGQVEDFLMDDKAWIIRYLAIDTGNWLSGKKVLLASMWVNRINWLEQSIAVDVDRKIIKNGPEYNPSKRLTREDEENLCEYYCGVKYWI